jgi:hypothetical protein
MKSGVLQQLRRQSKVIGWGGVIMAELYHLNQETEQ